MTAWILTLGLQNLRRQVDAVFPDRDRTSDGTIGDAAHQAETSGHNPDDTPGSKPEWDGDPDSTPEVRAWDMDSDLPGITAQELVDHVRALPGIAGVIRYLIYNSTMYHERDGFEPTPYTGASAHTEHVHFSGAWAQAADQNTTFDFHLEDLVALTQGDRDWIAAQIATVTAADKPQSDGTPTSKIGRLAFNQGVPNGTKDGQPRDAAWQVLQDLGEAVLALQKLVGALGEPDPAVLATAIAAAIPANLASQVADVLAQRLSA